MKKNLKARKASALLMVMIFTTVFTAIVAVLFSELTFTGNGIRRNDYNTAVAVTAANARTFILSQIKRDLSRPLAEDPATALAGRIDTVVSLDAAVVNAMSALPGSSTVTIDFTIRPPVRVGIGGAFDAGYPVEQAPTCNGKSVTQAFLIPVEVRISAQHARYGRRDITYRVNLVETMMPFAQYALCFGNFSAHYIGEPNTVIRGGVAGMDIVHLTSTYEQYSRAGTAPLQVDFVGAKTVSFDFYGRSNKYNKKGVSTRVGSTNSFTGVYVWQGDVIPGQPGPQFFTMGNDSTKLSRQVAFNPYAAYSAKENRITAEVLPTFETVAGPGEVAKSYMDYYNPKGLANSTTRYKIDSANPDFNKLVGRFNGNVRDASTGWTTPDVASLPEKVSDLHALIEPPLISNPTGSGYSEEDFKSVEAAKVSNQAKLYVVVEQPDAPGMRPPEPIFFTDAQTAAAYKLATGQDPISVQNGRAPTQNQAARQELLRTTAYSSNVLNLQDYPEVVEVKRSFYDSHLSDSRVSSANLTTLVDAATKAATGVYSDKRVSAVDVNLGKLAELVKSKVVTTFSGSGWDPASPKNWNGVFYVDVVQPVGGTGWVSYDPNDQTPLTYNEEGVLVKPRRQGKAEPKEIDDPIGSYGTTVVPASRRSSKIGNGEEVLIAARLYNGTNVPTTDAVKGFTFATNVSAYTVGSINADGLLRTDKSVGTEKVPPMNIFCDSMTYFPESYMGDGGNKSGSLDYGDKFLSANYRRYSTLPSYQDWKYVVPFASVGDNATELNFVTYSGMADREAFYSGNSSEPNKVTNFMTSIKVTDDSMNVNHTLRYTGSRNLLFKPKLGAQFRTISEYNAIGVNGTGALRTFDNFDMSLRTGTDTAPASLANREFYIQSVQVLAKSSS